MTVTVHNARKPLPEGYTPIYVGRKTTYQPAFGADFSTLGNPFVINKSATRRDTIILYRQWLPTRLQADTPQARALEGLVERVRAGESLLLICWCAPLVCHADVIKQEVERLVEG
ncbi:DUF4326 domain-containing protein [Deinococcus sp. QL22]|uniref:DUF4326 domain-containing protein n=1 Tax=Deinococcus sp. QL22 TaxID=2939437 RepID=UPI002016FAE3|nr:DUF4326 domain-containing protein [Deinococcus sp. QL22]UQN08237.1 DUF4326 domain-containing protein [Deinococcus sp. QL22]